MPIYLGTKKLKCGYFGTVPLEKTFFGKDLVCVACGDPFPKFPVPTATARFSMMIKSSADLMLDWLDASSGLSSLVGASNVVGTTGWSLASRGVDKDGNFDFELMCTATVTRFKFAYNNTSILNIQIAKSVNNVNQPIRCNYNTAFNHLPNLKTFQILPEVRGAAADATKMFYDNKNLEYVDLPKTLFSVTNINYVKMFMDTPKLRFISYLDTRHVGYRTDMFVNSNPLRPSADEREALVGSWGSRFSFDICRMFADDSWKKSDKTSYSIWRIVFNNKKYGGSHHSSAVELYAYSSEDGHEQLAASKHELTSFEANRATSGYPFSNLIDRNLSTYWLSYHWGNGHFGWTYKVPQAFDSFRLRSHGHTSTNAGDTAAHAMGRDFTVMARNNVSDAWVTVFTHRVTDAGNYGDWARDENRTMLVPD